MLTGRYGIPVVLECVVRGASKATSAPQALTCRHNQTYLQIEQVSTVLVQVAQCGRDVRHNLHSKQKQDRKAK